MKRIFLCFFVSLMILPASSQVKQLVFLKDGTHEKLFLEELSDDTVYYLTISSFKRDIKTKAIAKSDIERTQTLEVRFLDDAYDKQFSGASRKLAFGDAGSSSAFRLFVSGRQSGELSGLCLKLKYSKNSDEKSDLHIESDGLCKIIFLNEDTVMLSLKNPYMLHGTILYNFAYIIPNPEQMKKLLSHPIKTIYIQDKWCGIKDEYMIMRHLYALLEDQGFEL